MRARRMRARGVAARAACRIAEWGVKRERLPRVSECGENVKSAYIIGAGSILPAVGPSWGDLQPYSERAGCRVRCLGGAMK